MRSEEILKSDIIRWCESQGVVLLQTQKDSLTSAVPRMITNLADADTPVVQMPYLEDAQGNRGYLRGDSWSHVDGRQGIFLVDGAARPRYVNVEDLRTVR